MKENVLIGALALIFGSMPIQAATISNANVTGFGAYGDGTVYVNFDKTILEPGCTGAFIELAPDAPTAKIVLANSAIAMSTGATVSVTTSGCRNASPTFTTVRSPATGLTINKP